MASRPRATGSQLLAAARARRLQPQRWPRKATHPPVGQHPAPNAQGNAHQQHGVAHAGGYEVPNPGGLLLPGLFVRVRLEQAQASNAITVPQQAVTRNNQGDSVMVVAADGKVSSRPVKLAAAKDNQWVVLSGLQAGEQVMVDGFQKLRGSAPVKAVPWKPVNAAASATPTAVPVAAGAPAAAAKPNALPVAAQPAPASKASADTSVKQ